MTKRTGIIFGTDEEFRSSLALLLEDDFKIWKESDLRKALNRAENLKVDLLILDFDLYNEDNWDTVSGYGLNGLRTNIISIYVYNKNMHKIDLELKKISDAVLYKPLDIDKFLNTVKRLCSKAEAAK